MDGNGSGRHVDQTRIVLRPVGSGLPLGFFAFGIGMLLLACSAIGWIPVSEQKDVGPSRASGSSSDDQGAT